MFKNAALALALSSCSGLALGQTSVNEGPPPQATLPDWLHIRGSLLTRYESLSNRLRRTETGHDRGLFTRVLLEVSVRDTFTEATVEMIDARLSAEPDDARPTTGDVDTVDLLQGYVAARFTDTFEVGDSLRVQLGRHTMDVGDRRLIARNVYRNAINAFTGFNAQWEGTSGGYGRFFYTVPVQRLPGDRASLLDGDPRFDEERTQVRFFGGILGNRDLWRGAGFEAFVYGLQERDAADLPTSDRQLTTAGARSYRAPAPEAWHWEVTSVYQFGRSRVSPTALENLDHAAYFHHANMGYTLRGPSALRIEALFDLASGDRSPDDGENNRFDSLFGIPRQDFGPPGIFHPFARSNVLSPGIRLSTRLSRKATLVLTQRLGYLASSRDAWTNGYVDPTGNAGDHVGDLTEVQFLRPLFSDSLRLELGAAYFAAGGFAKSAPDASAPHDAVFGYAQLTLFF